MKSKAINSLGYSGIVTLSRYVGQKKVKIAQFHNAGGTALFDFLAECLIGEVESAKAKRPAKVKLFYREQIDPNNEAAGYKYTSASGFIFLYQNAERNSNYSSQCRVTYTFQITRLTNRQTHTHTVWAQADQLYQGR